MGAGCAGAMGHRSVGDELAADGEHEGGPRPVGRQVPGTCQELDPTHQGRPSTAWSLPSHLRPTLG